MTIIFIAAPDIETPILVYSNGGGFPRGWQASGPLPERGLLCAVKRVAASGSFFSWISDSWGRVIVMSRTHG